MSGAENEITKLLREVKAGNAEAEAILIETVYQELRRLAGNIMRFERQGHTLQPTALVNEAYLELVRDAKTDWKDRNHFFAAAARSMRRILVDYARMRQAEKREGERQRVPLTDFMSISDDRLDEVIAIDSALTRLSEFAPRSCRIVELRFFAGLTLGETADVLGLARRTVSREWDVARAWLQNDVGGGLEV